MKISEDIKPISYVKRHTNKVLEQIQRTGRPVIITQNGEPAAVLEGVKTYEEQQEIRAILEIARRGTEEISEGKVAAHSDVLKAARDRLRHQKG